MSKKAGILLSIVVGILVALWIWTLAVPKNSISIGGSTSVDPLMQRLTNQYRKNNKESFIYSSSGSQGGIKNIESNTYKMGFISKEIPQDGSISLVEDGSKYGLTADTLSDPEQIYKYLANTNSLNDQKHYLKIATDAIIVVYHAPKLFVDNFKHRFSIRINLEKNKQVDEKSANLIKLIYGPNPTWSAIAQYLVDENPDKSKPDDAQVIAQLSKDSKNKLKAFSREPGSGTRNSFERQMKLDSDKSSTIHSSVLNSNGMMYQEMTHASSFGYLSLNYLGAVKANHDLNFLIIDADNEPYDPENLTNFEDYPSTRPYIGLFKADLNLKNLKQIAEFVAWMAIAQTDSKSLQARQYKIEGLSPVFSLDGVNYVPGV